MKPLDLFGSWLTVNRYCNFRCVWCYAEGTQYSIKDDMELGLAMKLIDLETAIGIRNVIFIGGEPTFWRHLFQVNDYVGEKGMTSYIVTNGFLFSSKRFMEKVQRSPFDNVTVSLKAGNSEQHERLTGTGAFAQVLAGIRNLSQSDQSFDVSITLSSLVADNLDELVKVAVDAGAEGVKIEFCATTFRTGGSQRGYMMHPTEVVKCILHHYDAMNRYTDGNLMVEESIPFCLWPPDFLATLKERRQIISGCHVLRKEGLIFDPHGKVIPCNDLYDCPLGQYGVDFTDSDSFSLFWTKPDVVEFYNRIIAYPSEQCIGCEHYEECGGGCPLQWFIFDPQKIIPRR